MSNTYNPPDADKLNLPVFNEANFTTGDGTILTRTESDIRYLAKTGGTITGQLKVSKGDILIQQGSLFLYNSSAQIYINDHVALSDTYMFAKNYISIGDKDSVNNIKITQNGSASFPGSTDFSWSGTGTGILNFKYGDLTSFIMNMTNGKMVINGNSLPINDTLQINGNVSITQTLNCNSLTSTISLVPAGFTIMWGSTSIPTGWLLCNGSSYSKSLNNNQYLALWNIIGYNFGGSGDNFNVPNLIDRFPLGATSSIGGTGGASTKILTTSNLPSHSHSYQRYKADGDYRRAAASTGEYFWSSGDQGSQSSTTEYTDSVGTADPFSILNPYIKLLYIIKY